MVRLSQQMILESMFNEPLAQDDEKCHIWFISAKSWATVCHATRERDLQVKNNMPN